MKKIIIVIGQSAAGKTTFVKKVLLKEGGENKISEKGVKYYEQDNVIALGHYYVDKRCEGTDTMSYSILPKIIEFIDEIKDRDIILLAEGDRINCKRFFDFIKTLQVDTNVYLFKCSLATSIERREKTGSKPSLTFVKTTITKSMNMAFYATSLGFKLITEKT